MARSWEHYWEKLPCRRCKQMMYHYSWNGWVETHHCENRCRNCNQPKGQCADDCYRYVDIDACEHCDGWEWLPERYIGMEYPGRWRCPCYQHFKHTDPESQKISLAIIALKTAKQMEFNL